MTAQDFPDLLIQLIFFLEFIGDEADEFVEEPRFFFKN
jgi:hypothetical protein